ncbi:MAG TPA: Mov34/MPN/PAD-1 family protein [Kouleothrix sp.]|nr:Mov34/MPN/PAD-1 family protein [Kouleothrix sp.]
MSGDLSTVFGGLVRHQVARTDTRDWQERRPGIAWLYAANGVFKRASNGMVEAQGRACHIDYDVPGLAALMEYVAWSCWHGRLPGALLAPLLRDAQVAGRDAGSGVLRPIEKQYFFVERAGGIYVVAPRAQQGSAGSVRYAMPAPASGTPLLDLHSHHSMRAFFSATDDRDDSGLSVSAVIGQIFTRPEIVVRLNIYGLHCPIPAALVFDSLGPFVDRYAGGSECS